MIIAVRIVLSLIALLALGDYVSWKCYFNFISGANWKFDCVAAVIGFQVFIPLAIALVAGYVKKSKTVFLNVFVGTFFVVTVGAWLNLYFPTF